MAACGQQLGTISFGRWAHRNSLLPDFGQASETLLATNLAGSLVIRGDMKCKTIRRSEFCHILSFIGPNHRRWEEEPVLHVVLGI